ncbi:MAG: alpha/beta fold hydrolase [Planctomycetes bacterium]|nr:alpha/beta fold hydrolase [Planctomycetota bacterium]
MPNAPDDTFTLPGAEGVSIHGDLYLPTGMDAPPLVLVLHGFKGFKDWGFFPWLGRSLADSGLCAALMNFSHCGIQAGRDHFDRLDLFEQDTWGKRLLDVLAVLNAAQAGALTSKAAPNPARLGIVGHSMGGGVALLAAAKDGRVRSLVTLAGVSSALRFDGPDVRLHLRELGHVKVMNTRTNQEMRVGQGYFDELDENPQAFDVAAAAARITLPWLIVHGVDDESVPIDEAHELLDAANTNPVQGENVKLLTLDGTGHTFGAQHPFAYPTTHLEQAASAVSSHLLRTL